MDGELRPHFGSPGSLLDPDELMAAQTANDYGLVIIVADEDPRSQALTEINDSATWLPSWRPGGTIRYRCQVSRASSMVSMPIGTLPDQTRPELLSKSECPL